MLRTLMILLAFAVAGAAWAQPPRCWKNDEGVTECGLRPPPDVQSREVRTLRVPTVEAVREAEAFGEADLDEEERTRIAIQTRQCELARETLAAYERSEFLYERDPQGNRRVLEEEETERVKAEAREIVAQSCAGLNDA